MKPRPLFSETAHKYFSFLTQLLCCIAILIQSFSLSLHGIAMAKPVINLEGFILSDEGLTVDLQAETQILQHCLIGKVITDKVIRVDHFRQRMAYVWKPLKKVTITTVPDDRFLFQFNHSLDAAKVLDNGPWLYENYNMVIERITPGMVPAEVNLNSLNLWVQVHGLPLGLIQPRTGNGCSHYLGVLKEYDPRNNIQSAYCNTLLSQRINI